MGFTGSATSANRKEQLAKQREYLKKKKLKKQERFKQLETEREKEKSKWQNFSTKAFGKKGFVKKSIFKTPENPTGRVGIGTCGVGGAEMTKYTSATKHHKRFQDNVERIQNIKGTSWYLLLLIISGHFSLKLRQYKNDQI